MKHIVVTTINAPNFATTEIARGARKNDWQFVVIGDKKSPDGYDLDSARFFSIAQQQTLPFNYAQICPTGHYARKNIGYLIAMAEQATEILETDDDNIPSAEFFSPRTSVQQVQINSDNGWVNVYRYFHEGTIWPRGLPLDHVRDPVIAADTLPEVVQHFPIHQGLADENPDVDAVYRLLFPLPVSFTKGRSVAIGAGSNCPFNSQNTRWWPDAYPLLYLPFHCSFRMTDIWRSFIAQRILAARGQGVLFHEATVYQDRNEHDLMRDFRDEIEGYTFNAHIMEQLNSLNISGQADQVYDDLVACYECLIDIGVVKPQERELLSAWCNDCRRVFEKPAGEQV